MRIWSGMRRGSEAFRQLIVHDPMEIVFPLANLVATGQVKLGDFVRIDLSASQPGLLPVTKLIQ